MRFAVLPGFRKGLPLMVFRTLVPTALLVALAGCGSIGAVGMPWNKDKRVVQTQPAPLPPPNTSVQSAELAPINGMATYPPTTAGAAGSTYDPNAGSMAALPPPGTTGAGAMGDPLAPPAGTQTAMSAPASGQALGRTDLLGGWTITSGADSCQLFMTLTSWTGGYRASTRGCTSDTLKSISAWNLEGTSVVLAGQGGSPVATLASTAPNRFDGQAGGTSISFYR